MTQLDQTVRAVVKGMIGDGDLPGCAGGAGLSGARRAVSDGVHSSDDYSGTDSV